MIARHQPTIFPDRVIVRVSDVSDGTMALRTLPENPGAVWQNRTNFIEASGGELATARMVYVTYDDTRSYDEYKLAEAVTENLQTSPDDIADGLATQQSGVGLFLPVADCCAVVLYDRTTDALMLSHLGRHSVERDGARKSLEFMKAQFGTRPDDVLVWLGPAVGSESYPIFKRGNKSLKELIVNDLKSVGVAEKNLEISPVDTARDRDYFSHSEYQKGRRASDGRFAVFTELRTT